MIDFLRWLLVLEIVGVAALPLSLWLFARLPDRGYAFAKLLGVLLVTWLVWLIGFAVPIADSAILPAAIVVAMAAAGWWLRASGTLAVLSELRRVVAAEEILFLAAIVVWSVMRASVFHPGISHTEQYMDLNFLQGTLHSASFPPLDPWMSGHSINYYYFGYLMFATLIKLSGVAPAVAYNLALSTVFALTITGAFSAGYALTCRLRWALVAPLFVALLGNWHAVLVQLPAGHDPGSFNWFWDSTRVVGGSDTINEFPYFSFMLGDLHPHVMALPVTILAIALAMNLLFWPEPIRLGGNEMLSRLAITAICVGSLYAINSWDFPTYLVVVGACVVAAAYLTDESRAWWRAPLASVPALAAMGVAAFLPFYLTYKSPAHGIGWVTTPSNLGQFLQIFGFFLLIAAILLVAYSLILQPADDVASGEATPRQEQPNAIWEVGAARAGDTYLTLAAVAAVCLVAGIRFQQWTLALLLVVAGATLVLLWRVLNTDEPNRADVGVLLLLAGACLILAGTEVVYLRDQFDGGANYRMNTVFKFYYQAWTLLGLAGTYGAYRAWQILRKHFGLGAAAVALLLIAVGAAAGGVYTLEAPQSAEWGGTDVSLNGESALQQQSPGDDAGIAWLRAHSAGNPVELEAGNGGDYQPQYGRVAVFSGLPTVMGWAGHEYQWRGNDPEIQTRVTDSTTIFTTPSIATARALLQKYNVCYVFVGETEKSIPGAHLDKFARFLRVAFSAEGTTIYTW